MLSPQQISSFQHRGFCVLERAMPKAHIDGARAAADALVQAAAQGKPYPPSFLREGESYEAISKAGSRFFFSNRCETFPALEAFVKGQLTGEIARDLLGPAVCLFNEQVVVKAPQHGDSFAWHQDSGYIRFAHRPYLTLWCALDDSTRDNGTVVIIPRDISKETSVSPHEWDEGGANLVGYRGSEAGEMSKYRPVRSWRFQVSPCTAPAPPAPTSRVARWFASTPPGPCCGRIPAGRITGRCRCAQLRR